MTRRGYRRPPDVPAELRKVGRAVEKGVKQAGRDIVHGGRILKEQAGAAVRKAREGVRRIKKSVGR